MLPRSYFFFKLFEKRQMLRNVFDVMEKIFFGRTSQINQIFPKTLGPQNKAYRDKLSFLVF